MATDTDTEPSRTPASYWARPNSHRSTPASILRADLTANLTDLPAEDATVLLGPRFWKLPTELFDEVVSQLPSSVDVMAAVSSLWRVAVWRALAAWFRTYEQLRAAAGVVRARFPCLHKGNAKQLRWPVEFDDVAPAVLSHQPWLKSVSWDDFKTTQAAIAAFLAQDSRPPPVPMITYSEELFASRLPELPDFSVSVRLLHGSTLIGSHDGPVEFKLHSGYGGSQEAVFDLYALDAFASNDGYPCLMSYDHSRREYCSRNGPEVEPYPVNSVLQKVFKEQDDPLLHTFDKLRVVVFLTLGSKMVRVLDSPLNGDEPTEAALFTTKQDLPLSLLRAEHVCGPSTDNAAEFPVDPAAAGTWGVETQLMLEPFHPESCGEARLTIKLTDDEDDWVPSSLFLRRLFAARLEIDSDFNHSPAAPAQESGA